MLNSLSPFDQSSFCPLTSLRPLTSYLLLISLSLFGHRYPFRTSLPAINFPFALVFRTSVSHFCFALLFRTSVSHFCFALLFRTSLLYFSSVYSLLFCSFTSVSHFPFALLFRTFLPSIHFSFINPFRPPTSYLLLTSFPPSAIDISISLLSYSYCSLTSCSPTDWLLFLDWLLSLNWLLFLD